MFDVRLKYCFVLPPPTVFFFLSCFPVRPSVRPSVCLSIFLCCRAANPTLLSPSANSDEVGELKRRVKKLEEAVAALQAVSARSIGRSVDRCAPGVLALVFSCYFLFFSSLSFLSSFYLGFVVFSFFLAGGVLHIFLFYEARLLVLSNRCLRCSCRFVCNCKRTSMLLATSMSPNHWVGF